MTMQTQAAPTDAALRAATGANGSATATTMRCPDPAAHKAKDTSLQDTASAAALLSVKSAPQNRNPLGPDGRLSSASAATSLKHAQPQDLPSFPVVGIDARTSAGTAANLASANTKSYEWWKPKQSAAAGKAALLANSNTKSYEWWQPEASAAGSKAALLAHKDGAKVDIWIPEASAYGNSAANIAMGKKGLGPQVDYSNVEEGRKKALVAATGAVSNQGRKRSNSTPAHPPLYPDAGNSAKNALSAATIAHSPSMRASQTAAAPAGSIRLKSEAMEAARIQHSKVSREMYTDRPPVGIEVEERKRNDALRASAVSMAKKMYDMQQHHIDQAAGRQHTLAHAQTGATAAHGQQPSNGQDEVRQQAMRYIGIQEAAQKLAAERLAKLEPSQDEKYRSYYGYDKMSVRSKLSIRGRGRNRASSNPETADSDDDEAQSRRIRSQMSQFNKSLAEVDTKRRDQDRAHLMAAAQRKVQAQMLGMDKKIFDETGNMSPAMLDEWDARARAKAAANSEARMENHGRVHIGHGKYMDQKDIDAIALSRVQPTLNDITERTEKRRAEEEEQRLEQEEKKRQEKIEAERAADIKSEEKRHRDEEKRAQKARADTERAAIKQEKEAEKEKRAEEKRLAKEDKRKSLGLSKPSGTASAPAPISAIGTVPFTEGTTTTTIISAGADPEPDNDDLYRDPSRPSDHATGSAATSAAAAPSATSTSPTSPTSPTSAKGLKSLLSKLKRRSKPPGGEADAKQPGFIGGAALRNSTSASQPEDAPDATASASHPTHIPALADTDARRFSAVSSVSSVGSGVRGRSVERERSERGVSPPAATADRITTGESAVSPGAASEYEEAKDGFDEGLVAPPAFASLDEGGRRSFAGSPSRDSRFREEGI